MNIKESLPQQNKKNSKEDKEVDFNSKEWWNISEVSKALNISRGKLNEFSKPLIENHPEWINKNRKFTGSKWTKERGLLEGIWNKELILAIKTEIENSRKHEAEEEEKLNELVQASMENSETLGTINYDVVRKIFYLKEWWNSTRVAEILHIDGYRLKELANPYLVANPEFANDNKKWNKELIFLLINQIERSRQVPEGWKNIEDLLEITGCSRETTSKILKVNVENFADKKSHVIKMYSSRGGATSYYSPKAYSAVVEQLKSYPLIPVEYRAIEDLPSARTSPANKFLIKQGIKKLKDAREIEGKFFTNPKNGLVVECLSREELQTLENFLRKKK